MIKDLENKSQKGLGILLGSDKNAKTLINILKYSLIFLLIIYIIVFLLKMF
jgi:hypothetical protein